MMMISGFTQDVHCAVQEIHRHRQKISDEREAEHKKRLADLERELMKQPHGIWSFFFINSKESIYVLFCSSSHKSSS